MTPNDPTIPGEVAIPNVQVSAHYPPGIYQLQGFSDRDNFVTNDVTMLDPAYQWYFPCYGVPPVDPNTISVPISRSGASRPPVLTLTQVKLWLRIEPTQTDEDDELTMLEVAAHLYTEKYLRQTLDPTVQDDQGNALGIGENIQMAMLLLIAEWYRNRELMVSGRLAEPPFAFAALLSTERDYPGVY